MQEGFHNVTILGRNTLDESELVQVTFEMVGPTRGLTIEDWQEVTRLGKIQIIDSTSNKEKERRKREQA